MALVKQVDISGRDYYESLYASELDGEAEWQRRSAAPKVDSIQTLLARHSINAQTIMELGCGVGAVICECRRRELARRYIGVDYSADAVTYLRTHAPEIEAIQADINSPDFAMKEAIDVVVLTHVIEHLDDPHQFLTVTLQKLQFKYMIAEVPLEDLLAGRLKNLFRDRRINTGGHVQFFNPSSFKHLLTAHGLKILDRRRYIPVNSLDTIRFLQAKDGLSPLGVSRMIASSVLARAFYPLWARLYYSHYAVLCTLSDAAPGVSATASR
jgi:2-polyprenyl-3-methyl-5-hydroxy-6-metoxy-1,4-benzoquinol methylase